MKKILAAVLVLGITLFVPQKAESSTLIFDAFDSGWWSDLNTSSADNENYIVGNAVRSNTRNFFSFNLSTLNENINSAKLEVTRGQARRVNFATDPYFYTLFDVSTDINILNNTGAPNNSIYNDLGSGNSYGTFQIAALPRAYSNQTLIFDLNLQAINDINFATGGNFAIGGTLLTPFSASEGNDYIFGQTGGVVFDPPVRRLILETDTNVIPEPGTMLLLSTGLVGGAFIRRKRR